MRLSARAHHAATAFLVPALIASAFSPVPAAAQTPAGADSVTSARPPASAVRPDTTATAGRIDTAALVSEARDDGRRAADERGVLRRGLLAFFGGLPVGLLGPFAISDHAGVAVVPTVAGAAVVGAASAVGSAAPPTPLAARAAARGPVYERAYREAYEGRLRARRGRAGVVGGLTGAAAGLGALLYLVSQLNGAS